MTVTFIRFITEDTDVSTNNQLAGCKTHNHFRNKLLLHEAAMWDAVLIEWTCPVYPGTVSLTVYRVKDL
jgi:hypothetical protein